MHKILSVLVTCLAMGAAFCSQAQTFDRDGYRFTILDEDKVSIRVVPDSAEHLFSGRVEIPTTVFSAMAGGEYTVAEIADSAFFNCREITSLVLPASIQSVGKNTVDHCFVLQEFEVAGGGHFSVQDGVLFDADATTLIVCPAAKTGKYVVPVTVDSIAPAAFSSCKNINEVVLPQRLKAIQDYTFYECWGLANVSFPDALETIGNYAFDGSILQFLFFGKSLKSIGDHAFDRSSMVEVMLLCSTPPALGEMAFGNEMDMAYTRLYVPVGTRAKYKATGWTIFPVFYEGNRSRRWNPATKR